MENTKVVWEFSQNPNPNTPKLLNIEEILSYYNYNSNKAVVLKFRMDNCCSACKELKKSIRKRKVNRLLIGIQFKVTSCWRIQLHNFLIQVSHCIFNGLGWSTRDGILEVFHFSFYFLLDWVRNFCLPALFPSQFGTKLS